MPIVPQLDPMPAPAPIWLLRTLLLLTFFLHLLFMNTLLGGTVVTLICNLRRKQSAHAAQLASDMAHLLPVIFAFTITLGVAPLLFLQVLYGHLLYASSVIMGVPWLSIVGLVMCAYYAVYYFSFRRERTPAVAGILLGIAVVAERDVAAAGHATDLARPRRDRFEILVEHDGVGRGLDARDAFFRCVALRDEPDAVHAALRRTDRVGHHDVVGQQLL